MKKLLTLLLLSPLAFAETLPLCKDTLLYWVNYFDDCRTDRYVYDGIRYTGGWKNNKHHGQASYKDLKSDAYFSGGFFNGKRHGAFLTLLADNTAITANYSYGELIDRNTHIGRKNLPESITSYAQPLPSTGSSSSDGSFLAEMGASLLGGNKSSSSSSTSKPINSNRTYSSSLTVPSNQLCPMLASPVVKQEVVRGNRICYYQ